MTKKVPIPDPNPKVKSLREWGGFAFGDLVKITGDRGIYRFMGHCTHVESGNEWVALYGGDKDPTGHRQFRYVDPGRVKRVPGTKGGRS